MAEETLTPDLPAEGDGPPRAVDAEDEDHPPEVEAEEAEEDEREEEKHDDVDFNERFLKSLSYFIEWAKHIITIGSAVLVLGATFLKDVLGSVKQPYVQPVAAGLLVAAYVFMLLAIWQALKFISTASSTVFTEAEVIADGDALLLLQSLIRKTQQFFLIGIICFSALAIVSLVAWALDSAVTSGLSSGVPIQAMY